MLSHHFAHAAEVWRLASGRRCGWTLPLPAEQYAKPSAELVQQSAELRQALSKGQSVFDYYKVKFSDRESEAL